MDRHIFLIGFMGVGKSTVARGLSRLLHINNRDTDKMIENYEHMKISDIFDQKGEAYFRECETRLLRHLQTREPMIIACGGGMAMRSENVALMKECGTIVLLTARPQTILHRTIRTHKRPLLEGHKNVRDISALMNERMPKYEAAADIKVSTDYRNTDEICREIAEKLGLLS